MVLNDLRAKARSGGGSLPPGRSPVVIMITRLEDLASPGGQDVGLQIRAEARVIGSMAYRTRLKSGVQVRAFCSYMINNHLFYDTSEFIYGDFEKDKNNRKNDTFK
jgi:hypothetical protein